MPLKRLSRSTANCQSAIETDSGVQVPELAAEESADLRRVAILSIRTRVGCGVVRAGVVADQAACSWVAV
jgi:hypothetical protein